MNLETRMQSAIFDQLADRVSCRDLFVVNGLDTDYLTK